jgi:thiamine-phosphate pyrophosphorylase
MPSERAAATLRGLYAVTPEMADTGRLAARVAAAVAGGAALVQYRAKQASAARAREQAGALVEVCRAAGVPLIVNDSVELAIATGAHGVHLGRGDGDVRAARERMPRGIIGVSCYAEVERAAAAAAEGADYVAIGSVFASSTKPGAVHAPLGLLAAARSASLLPVVAIGGIDAGNAGQAIEAGADMVAVISALFDSHDTTAAARAIARLFDAPHTGNRDVRTQPQTL